MLPTARALQNHPRSYREKPLYTVVLPKIPHCNSSKRVPNRPLRGRRGRFGTLLQQLECGIFGRTAVVPALNEGAKHWRKTARGLFMIGHSRMSAQQLTQLFLPFSCDRSNNKGLLPTRAPAACRSVTDRLAAAHAAPWWAASAPTLVTSSLWLTATPAAQGDLPFSNPNTSTTASAAVATWRAKSHYGWRGARRSAADVDVSASKRPVTPLTAVRSWATVGATYGSAEPVVSAALNSQQRWATTEGWGDAAADCHDWTPANEHTTI